MSALPNNNALPEAVAVERVACACAECRNRRWYVQEPGPVVMFMLQGLMTRDVQ